MLRAPVYPLCAPTDDRDDRSGNGSGGRRRTRITLTSLFIGDSDPYATRFSNRLCAFLYIPCTLIFLRQHTPGDFCFAPSRSPASAQNREIHSRRQESLPPTFEAALFYSWIAIGVTYYFAPLIKIVQD